MYDIYLTESIKENIPYQFWSRPTISWSLACDKEKTRVFGAAQFEQMKQDLD